MLLVEFREVLIFRSRLRTIILRFLYFKVCYNILKSSTELIIRLETCRGYKEMFGGNGCQFEGLCYLREEAE